jgi:hypothetical protein
MSLVVRIPTLHALKNVGDSGGFAFVLAQKPQAGPAGRLLKDRRLGDNPVAKKLPCHHKKSRP